MYPPAMLNMDANRQLYKHYEDCHSPTNCKVTLKNAELWKKFHELGTEMIITKSGRRMFPAMHIQIANLDPHAHYSILLEMNPVSHCRFKYTNSGGWTPAGTEEAQSPQRIYLHPDSPATGEYWMSQPISFGRLKLTNTIAPPAGHLVLSSMHKYQPRIIISKSSDPRSMAWAPSSSVVFPETQFIAVTAYQNEKITKLKIDNNPFAKGFRENGQGKSKRKRQDSESKSDEEKSSKQPKLERLTPLRVEEDRLSSCSSNSAPSSPEISHQTGDSPKRAIQSFPANYPYASILSTPPLSMVYPAYYPYPSYPTTLWGVALPPTLCQSALCSPSQTVRYPSVLKQELVTEKPRKLTDFSIRAITGCS